MAPPVTIRVLDMKTKRVRIHWFERTDHGPIQTGKVEHFIPQVGPLVLGGSKGRIACQPRLATLTSPMVAGKYQPIPCSDEVRAVTCPECQATEGFKKAASELAAVLGAGVVQETKT